MTRPLAIFCCLLALSFASTFAAESATYIPKDLDDAHRQLEKLLPAKELRRVRAMKSEDDMIVYHMGLGTGLRNDWGLWRGSRLARYFNALGIRHPDDMSGIILDTFWCKIHDRPFRLEAKIKYYQDYWQKMEREDRARKR